MVFVDSSRGIGNQMFHYAFMLSFREKGVKAFTVPVGYRMKKEHNGYELPNVFHLPVEDTSFSFTKSLFIVYRHFLGAFPKRLWRCIDRLLGIVTVRQTDQCKYSPELLQPNARVVFYRGAWQSQQYFGQASKKVGEVFHSFREENLSEKTKLMLQRIKKVEAVSLHVRRGDYLSHNSLGGVCTLEYYNKAFEYMTSHLDKPHFFIFSDDKDWVKNNLIVDDATIVDFNSGVDSWQDMFLMSKCRHNIIL